MMTLDEAIKHSEEQYLEQQYNAEAVRKVHGEHCVGYYQHCKSAEEHKQMFDWLCELRERRSKSD